MIALNCRRHGIDDLVRHIKSRRVLKRQDLMQLQERIPLAVVALACGLSTTQRLVVSPQEALDAVSHGLITGSEGTLAIEAGMREIDLEASRA